MRKLRAHKNRYLCGIVVSMYLVLSQYKLLNDLALLLIIFGDSLVALYFNAKLIFFYSEALNRRERLQVSGVNEADPLSGLLKTAGPNLTTGRKGKQARLRLTSRSAQLDFITVELILQADSLIYHPA